MEPINYTVGVNNNENYLDRKLSSPPAQVGERHVEIIELSLQMIGEGHTAEGTFRAIKDRFPEKPDSEIQRAISGAIRRKPQPALTARSGRLNYHRPNSPQYPLQPDPTVVEYEHDGSTETLPAESIQMKPSEFFKFLGFHESEYVWFANKQEIRGGSRDGEIIFKQHKDGVLIKSLSINANPSDEFSMSLDDEFAMNSGFDENGSYFAVNPFKSGEGKDYDDEESQNKGRLISNVSRFLYTMVEFDSIPREEQLARFRRSGLPIKCLIDTGGKSIHAIVIVNAADLQEYQARVQQIRQFIGQGADESTKDSVRFSRLPSCRNGESMQRLISKECGAASFEEWADSAVCDGLPDIESPEEFLKERMKLDPYLIDGLLRENSKMSMTSQSKAGKSWLLLWMALCVGSGKDWLGHKCTPQRVLYVNLELKKNGANNRVYDICEAMKINPVTGHKVDFWNLRGKAADIEVMANRILRRISRRDYKLVILDPGYKCLGWRDENKAGDITDFQNHVERICTEAGVSIIVVGHTPKGDISARAANDRQSGSSVWSRDPDVIASFLECTDQQITDKHGETIKVEFSGMREDVTPKAFLAKREFPILSRLSDAPPDSKKKLPERAVKILKVLGDKYLTWSELFSDCEKNYGMDKTMFNRGLKDLEKWNKAENVNGAWKKVEDFTFSVSSESETE